MPRASRTLERAILHGTTHIRTHVEIDPAIGLQPGLDGVRASWRARLTPWAVDIEICVFPQEGLLNYPGTEERLVQALKQGVKVLGAAPYCDSDPQGQIDRIFALAREFRRRQSTCISISAARRTRCRPSMSCAKDGRNTAGAAASPIGPCDAALDRRAGRASIRSRGRLADCRSRRHRCFPAPISISHRPATSHHSVMRGVVPAHRLMAAGVNCTIAHQQTCSNPFTPYGDASLIRQANLYANVSQLRPQERHCRMPGDGGRRGRRKLLRLNDYGIAVGQGGGSRGARLPEARARRSPSWRRRFYRRQERTPHD